MKTHTDMFYEGWVETVNLLNHLKMLRAGNWHGL